MSTTSERLMTAGADAASRPTLLGEGIDQPLHKIGGCAGDEGKPHHGQKGKSQVGKAAQARGNFEGRQAAPAQEQADESRLEGSNADQDAHQFSPYPGQQVVDRVQLPHTPLTAMMWRLRSRWSSRRSLRRHPARLLYYTIL